MRGKGFVIFRNVYRNRITPAYAGKSVTLNRNGQTRKDHPRLCGEKLAYRITSALFFRITPAYAGKRYTITSTGIVYQDHPRLCGEKENFSRVLSGKSGSPPPMRGKVFPTTRKDQIRRITPAYAGKSACSSPDKPYT